MKIQVIISCLAVLFAFNQTFAQTTFNPSMYDTYSINSPFTAYDITNKHGTGIAEMGSIPYNQWVFEKVSDNTFYTAHHSTFKTHSVRFLSENWLINPPNMVCGECVKTDKQTFHRMRR